MPSIDTVVIGGGHAGLAVSRCLTAEDHEHVVIERGAVAQRWRSERWDSLRLLTPNWLTRLPGYTYDGDEPNGFMAAHEVAGYLRGYARSFAAPVREGVNVERVERVHGGYVVTTDAGVWRAANVVVATGPGDRTVVPAAASSLSPQVRQVTARDYRNPDGVEPGGVLVVGASATGVQLADELAGAGRHVVVAVGDHARAVRRYRGSDIYTWLDRAGVLETRLADVPDPKRARREPSFQLLGSADGRSVDLAALHARGVEIVGHLIGIEGTHARFADDLPVTTARAERRLRRLLDRLDRWIDVAQLDGCRPPREDVHPVSLPPAVTDIDLRATGIGTVVWATGYRPFCPWLRVAVFDAFGRIVQRNGVTPAPGLYTVGQRFQTRRNSSFIDGARHDARLVTDRLTGRRDLTALAG